MSAENRSLNPEEIRDLLRQRYPGLALVNVGDECEIEGTYDLRERGDWVDSFLIRMHLPQDYPRSIPIVHEIGGRIPKSVDFHINTGTDGSLCLGVPEELWIEYNGTFDVATVLAGPLHTYLLGVTEKIQGRRWPYGEREHGAKGLCQFYGSIIGTTESIRVLDLIMMLSKPMIKGHWPCPCGSGKKLRKCHYSEVVKLHSERLPSDILIRSGERIAHALGQDVERKKFGLKRAFGHGRAPSARSW